MTHTLLIGYGNCLRGDDGLGPAVADAVATWQLPGVRTLALPQLVPELVEELKTVERVLFVDATMEPLTDSFTMVRVEPHRSRRSLGHHEDPASLLALTRDLEGRYPDAWLLAILPHSFDCGERLTEIAQDRMQIALKWIRTWLTEPVVSCTKSD